MPITNLNRKLNNSKKILIWLIVILVFLGVFVVLPARLAYQSTKQIISSGKMLAAAAKTENLDQIKVGTISTKKALEDLNGALTWFSWMKLLPFAGGYVSDTQHFVKAGIYELEAVETIITILEPAKNELGLTGQITAGQDRVAQGMKILEKILPEMDKLEPSLKKARLEVEQIDIDKYPDNFKSITVKSRVEEIKNGIIGVDIIVAENRELLTLVPEALGATTPKIYLLLFQNDKEIRPTGGFITAYAFLSLNKGYLSTTKSDDIYRLDEQLLKACLNRICPLTPPAPIVKYLPEVDGKPRKAWSLRDSNLSPDLSISAAQFEKMYSYLDNETHFDGIITIDTQVVEELIKVIGPIDIFGTKFSADIDKRCNCPNVIYELEHNAEVAAKGEADRKAILGTLMQQIMMRTLGAGPQSAPDFINVGIKLANDKHIMFYMHNQKLQQALSKLGWTGQIAKTDGDYLHINEANFAGGKSNMYVDEKVTLEINTDNSGVVKHRIIIEYKNPQPFSIWLNGILRDYVRVYVPTGSKLVASKGSDDPVQTQQDEELDKTYFEAFVTVRPQNSRTLSFEYTVPGKLVGKTYPLLIQKQPGAKDFHYIVKLNGQTKAQFDLTSDKQLDLPI